MDRLKERPFSVSVTLWLLLAALGIIGLLHGNTTTHYDRGCKRLEAGDYNRAISSLRTVVDREPANEDAWYRLGQCYQTLGRRNDAISAYDKALSCAQHPITLRWLSTSYQQIGCPMKAETAYQKLCTEHPQTAVMYEQLEARLSQKIIADPHTAENGSYYGEISETTGRPKTVYVHGYYRKDGTYVRGHYRSAPRD